MGLGAIRKLKSVFKGGLVRKIGKLIGKAEGRLQKVRKFIFKLRLAQINRVASSTYRTASQLQMIAGSTSGVAGDVLGGVAGVAGGVASGARQASEFLSTLDERLFRIGRELYKKCYRILHLCAKVMRTISKYAKKIRRVIKIVRLALKIAKFILTVVGKGVGTKLIAKADRFLKTVEDALRIVQGSTGQLAAICRDLSDQLKSMKEKYYITDEDLSPLISDRKLPPIPDRLFSEDIFNDDDWDPEIDDDNRINVELAEIDVEMDSLEFEIEAILDRRAPQTKNACLRFLADLDCIDRLDSIIGGLNNINSSDSDAQSIIDRAKQNITTSRDNINSAAGNLDFQSVGFPPYDTSNADIISTIGPTKIAVDNVKELKDSNLDKFSKQGSTGIEYNDKNIPEYLDYRKHIDDGDTIKLTGPDFVSRYSRGISLRKAITIAPPGEYNQLIFDDGTGGIIID